MCTFLLQNDESWDMGLVHCGICRISLLCMPRNYDLDRKKSLFNRPCVYVESYYRHYINGLVQDYSHSIANALELLQPCSKPLIDTIGTICIRFWCTLIWVKLDMQSWGCLYEVAIFCLFCRYNVIMFIIPTSPSLLCWPLYNVLFGPFSTPYSGALMGKLRCYVPCLVNNIALVTKNCLNC